VLSRVVCFPRGGDTAIGGEERGPASAYPLANSAYGAAGSEESKWREKGSGGGEKGAAFSMHISLRQI